MPDPSIPPTIPPLVRRHAEDAAFYWARHDGGAHSPRLPLRGLERFSQLLAAHLEGLEAAGSAAMEPALEALTRWNKPAETFVCAYVAYAGSHQRSIETCWSHVESHPDRLLRGVVSALAWLPTEVSLDAIRTLSKMDAHPARQVAALRALTLLDTESDWALERPLDHYLRSADPHVRAAAWRCAAALPSPKLMGQAQASVASDPSLASRAEAAIALGRISATVIDNRHGGRAGAALLQCVTEQAAIADAAGGWNHSQAQRRLMRWVRWLAVLLPVGHPDVPGLLARLPARAGLSFAGAHGDPALLPYVVDHMSDPQAKRYAGWTWQTLTGVDLAAAGLSLPEPDSESVTVTVSDAQSDADHGLACPDRDAIRAYPIARLRPGRRHLLGREITAAHALSVCEASPQAQRTIALCHLSLRFARAGFTVRAHASRQKSALIRLRSSLEKGTAE